jgi:glycosyltransferase involved in cell wall biosynthesis
MIKVSTIIPVYNGAATITRAIDSALAQDFAAQEIIVVNDGSTDDTAAALAQYGDRIRVINKPNGGAASARNAGISVAHGEYVALLDADDEWTPDHLSKCVKELDANHGVILCFSGYIPKINGEAAAPRAFPGLYSFCDLIRSESFILPSASILRLSKIVESGGFPEQFRLQGFEDTYFFLRLSEFGCFLGLSDITVFYSSPHFSNIGVKYFQGFQHFSRLTTERYGEKAKPIIAKSRLGIASSLLSMAIERIDENRPIEGIAALFHLIKLYPSYLFKYIGPKKIFSPRNLRRLWSICPEFFVKR